MKPMSELHRLALVDRLIEQGKDPEFAEWVSHTCYNPDHPLAWSAFCSHSNRVEADR